jgi:hypothetical protein
MSRRKDDALLCCAASPEEAECCRQMREAGGINSDANLIRVALWSLADHMMIDVPSGIFDMRFTPGPDGNTQTKPNPKIKQDKPWEPPLPPKKPSRKHPWRQYREPLKGKTDG